MINSISTNRDTVKRINEEKNEVKRQVRREQKSYNKVDSDYKSLDAEMDIRDRKIIARK
jgi:hypothetical protein